jgi:hypothetical protein
VDVYIHIFLTSKLFGSEWSASRSGHSTLGERALGTHWIGGWAPEPFWTTWRRERFCPYRDSNSDPSVLHPIATRQWLPTWTMSNFNLRLPGAAEREQAHLPRRNSVINAVSRNAKGHAVALLVEALCYSRNVAGSSPSEVDFFNLRNPSSRTMSMGRFSL